MIQPDLIPGLAKAAPRFVTYMEYKMTNFPLAYRIDLFLDPWWVLPAAGHRCNESVWMIPGQVDPDDR